MIGLYSVTSHFVATRRRLNRHPHGPGRAPLKHCRHYPRHRAASISACLPAALFS